MKKIKTNAFFMDEDNNLCLMFGNYYIGIEAGEVKDYDLKYVKFEELQEPFYNEKSKKEDYKPRKDMKPIFLFFKDIESVDAVINALQEVRKHLEK